MDKVVLVSKDLGVQNYDNGDKYDGQWKDDQKTGQGIMTYANADKYEGGWIDDIREGNGKRIPHSLRNLKLQQWR